MRFNEHSAINGEHALLSASQYHWLNYDDEKLARKLETWRASVRGTLLHDLAHSAISLGIRLDKRHGALSTYVADGIDLGMSCEQVLYYSPNCFGTADTISFEGNQLRIHDLKTGRTKASMTQLEVYAAIFCLEYGLQPDIELRIYQGRQVHKRVPTQEEIQTIMDKIVYFDRRVQELKEAT